MYLLYNNTPKVIDWRYFPECHDPSPSRVCTCCTITLQRSLIGGTFLSVMIHPLLVCAPCCTKALQRSLIGGSLLGVLIHLLLVCVPCCPIALQRSLIGDAFLDAFLLDSLLVCVPCRNAFSSFHCSRHRRLTQLLLQPPPRS